MSLTQLLAKRQIVTNEWPSHVQLHDSISGIVHDVFVHCLYERIALCFFIIIYCIVGLSLLQPCFIALFSSIHEVLCTPWMYLALTLCCGSVFP